MYFPTAIATDSKLLACYLKFSKNGFNIIMSASMLFDFITQLSKILHLQCLTLKKWLLADKRYVENKQVQSWKLGKDTVTATRCLRWKDNMETRVLHWTYSKVLQPCCGSFLFFSC